MSMHLKLNNKYEAKSVIAHVRGQVLTEFFKVFYQSHKCRKGHNKQHCLSENDQNFRAS